MLSMFGNAGLLAVGKRHDLPAATVERAPVPCLVVGDKRYPLARLDGIDFSRAQAFMFKQRHRALAAAYASESMDPELIARIVAESAKSSVPLREVFNDYTGKLFLIWVSVAKNTPGIKMQHIEGWNFPLDAIEDAFAAALPDTTPTSEPQTPPETP